ncbi:chloramphenicol phosphotransferase CPT family protein [Longispora albida]|uniref:chloramphenicol phosphotransferase CPT family protein n=1 Tax=Longispora albida TaxID=203523 RepID=UPI0003730545|nr:hypothetical protein [Longispora albida]
MLSSTPGQIVVLNGPSRAGKSSIAAAVQDRLDGVWMSLGVDQVMQATPRRFQPGLGLRPGGERPELEPLVVAQYAALYESIAAYSRLGFNVVADTLHHDVYSVPRGILPDSARRLDGLPALLVGVRCPIEVIRQRRRDTWGGAGFAEGGAVADPVSLWQEAVHTPGIYDLEVDTSELSPEECAELIALRLTLAPAPIAFEQLRKIRA